MKYYLETNALIDLSNHLGNPALNDIAFTSVYAMLELVSGINNENFNRKRSALKKLHEAQLALDFIFPEEKLADCFSAIEFEEGRKDDLITLTQLIIESESINEASNKIAAKGVHFDLLYFIDYDDRWRKNFIDATIAGNKEIKQLLSAEKSTNEDTSNVLFNQIRSSKRFNFDLTLFSIAASYAKSTGIDEEEIFASYNGNGDIFIQALSDYGIDKMARNEIPAKNDIFDITHLLYLHDKGDVIVSNDRIYEKLFNGHTYSNVISNRSFSDKYLV